MLGTEIGLAVYIQTVFIVSFLVKHLIVDFYLQSEFMCKNKGTYGHAGGILHAGLHSCVSFCLLVGLYALFYPIGVFVDYLMFFIVLSAISSLFEFITHYHMDWFKMWWCKRKGYSPCDVKFWHWFGIDQFVHCLTYVFMLLFFMFTLLTSFF